MFNRLISEVVHIVSGLKPAADALAGTKASDVFSMANYGRACAILEIGEGATGTTKVTVEACDDVSASNTSAIAFKYRRCAAETDVLGAVTAATSSGFDTTAGGGDRYVIEFQAADLPDGYPFARIKCVEQANDPVYAAMTILLAPARYEGATHVSAIS